MDHKQEENHSSSSSENEYDSEFMTNSKLIQKKKEGRTSVSAEVYGDYNKKKNYVPKLIPKSKEQKQKISERLNNAFMFSSLDLKEKEIVIETMEIVKISKDSWVIKQGEDGDHLFVVDEGSLKCYKKDNKANQQIYLKTYVPGESFGELALLYNAPRAASIQAETDCILFSLDRECFNNIVKDATMKKRARYEQFLLGVEILQTMDPYERIKIADALKPEEFKAGQVITQQGDVGNTFYFLEEGQCEAFKKKEDGSSIKTLEYKSGSYFGELALIRDEPRAATVKAITDCKVVGLDRGSFKRLIGPVEEILKRNMEKYSKFI